MKFLGKLLIENFGYANQTFIRSAAHESFVTYSKQQPCGEVQSFSPESRCEFVQNTTECRESVNYLNYLDLIYCTFGGLSDTSYMLGVFLMCIWCLYLFTFLGTTADKFFCPALAVIAKLLNMSENLAGVTILAFGNGSPDIFTSLSNTEGDTELMYSELLGAAAFVTGLIAGLIILFQPFSLVGRNYIRDVCFFLIAATWISYSIHDQGFMIYESIGTIFIYFIYLAFVVVDHIRMKKRASQLRKFTVMPDPPLPITLKIIQETQVLEDVVNFQIRNRRNSSVISEDEIILLMGKPSLSSSPNERLWITFVEALNPIEITDWIDAGYIGKTLIILKLPVVFFLLLIIPIMDYGENKHGWSKLLNIWHIFTLPVFILVVTNSITKSVGQVPLWLIVFVISSVLATLVFFTSRNDIPPKYHPAFAAGSFIGSVTVIYVVAKEVVSVLSALGKIADLTPSMLGLSILAWGNSIGDLFSNLTLAKQGYQSMAFAACFGGPLFNTLFGIGLTFLIKAINAKSKIAVTREGAMGPNCVLFLFCILGFTTLAICLTRFQARKSIGIYMISMYALYIFYSVLGELEVIHPYGTDHQD